MSFQYNRDYQYYYEFLKMKNNQTAVIAFIKYDYDRHTDYYVVFGIANKKKILQAWLDETGNGDIELQTTGKSGSVEGLIWAYKKIQEFANEFHSDKNIKERKIIVMASDSRRYRIYKHYLSRIGFTEQPTTDGLTLIRKI